MTTVADSSLSRLATGGLLSIVGAGVSAIAGIALVAVVTNGFPRGLAGTLFAATAIWIILSSVSQLGTEVGLVRWIPILRATARKSEIPMLLRIALVPVVLASMLTAVALAAAAGWISPYLFGDTQARDGTVMLLCLAGFVPVNALYVSLLAATRGMGTMKTTVAVDLVARSVTQPLTVLAVAVLVPDNELALVLAWLFPFLPACVCVAFVLRRQIRDALATGNEGAGTNVEIEAPSLARAFWSFTSPRALATLSQAALKRVDIVMVAALRSPAEAAVYTAATRFIVLGQLAVQAIQQALSPLLSGLFASDDKRAAGQLFQTATAWMMTTGWPVYLISAGLAPLILSVFGDGYTEGTAVIVILALTMLFATASGSVDTVLLMGGRSWLSLFNNLVALVLNVTLNLLLIPTFGIMGAAISWAVAIVVRNLLPMIQVRSSFGMSPGGPAAMWVAMSALLCFGLPGLVLQTLGASSWTILGVLALIGTPAYLVLLWWRRDSLHLPLLAQTLRSRVRGRRSSAGAEAHRLRDTG